MTRADYEERMKNERYKELKVTTQKDEKPYVFISYRGNSWKKVLTEIVYTLQKKYGLRVYFDKEFANETYSWIDQFRENMDAINCKAVLCFFDEGYVTSYATLLELMHAMNPKSRMAKCIYRIDIDTIDWDKLDTIGKNTGLGEEKGDNPSYQKEKDVFDREFDLLKNPYPEIYAKIEAFYNKEPNLRICDCQRIMRELQPKNQREYVDDDSFYKQFIVEPLKKACPDLFETVDSVEPIKPEPGTHDKPKGPTNPKKPEGRTVIVVKPSGIKVDEATTLKQFEEACENINFCVELRNQRENSKKQMFDYLAAALLRGCDANVNKAQNGTDGEILRKGGYNYCTYTISNNIEATNPRIGSSQFTWCSNARKAMKTEDMPKYFFAEDGRVKSGHLGEYSEIFEALDENLTIGDVLKKFEAKEKGFETKNNDGIFDAWKLIKQIGSDTANAGNGKRPLEI